MKYWTLAALAACVLVADAHAASDTAKDRIARELARLEKAGESLGDQADTIAPALPRVKEALARDRLLFALDELQDAWTFEAAARWANAHGAIKTADQFSAEWKRVGEPRPGAAAPRVPAAVEAIAASNAVRAPATWRASLPYSQDAGMNAGLYYLGEAQAYAAFAAFCRSLPLERAGESPGFKSIADDISSLEAETAELYNRAPADSKSRFIRVSVGLKIAHSLDERADYGAAVYQYLMAKYRLTVATQAPATIGEVGRRLEYLRAHLPAGRDHSIAELFLERGAFLLENSDPSAARSASIIAETVLPEYLKLVTR